MVNSGETARKAPPGKPFKKGQSGNPNGRPRKLPALDKLMAELLGYEEGKPEETAAAMAMLRALYKKALKGNTEAVKIIMDRAYGKPKQEIAMNHSGEIGGKHVVEFKDMSKPGKG